MNDQSSSKCAIGRIVTSSCNSQFYSSKIGTIQFRSLMPDEKSLINCKLECNLTDSDQLCLDHKAKYLDKYETEQRYCCNPFGKSKHAVKTGLVKVDLETAEHLNNYSQITVKPGRKLCPACKAHYVAVSEADVTISSSSDEINKMHIEEAVDESLCLLDTSLLKVQRFSRPDKAGYVV